MPNPAANFPGRVSDGWLSLQGGTNSGVAPNLILPNQYAWAVNAVCRGGWMRPRPGYRKITLNWTDEEGVIDTDAEAAFKSALFQAGDGYIADDGGAQLMAAIGGRQFTIGVSTTGSTFNAREITIPGDENPPNRPMAWSIQVQNYWILQDGQSKPFIWNGTSAVRALENQIPVGSQMAYYGGRIWVAFGRDYVAGNIVFDPTSGSASLGYRDSLLYFTDNTFLNEGGSFNVPVQSGDITGFKVVGTANTALGEGELVVFTLTNAFATSVPADRTQWKNTTAPLTRMIQLSSGAYSQDSIVNVNEDLFCRTTGGVTTVAYTVRNQGQWGNRLLSTEMDRIFRQDAEAFLPYCRGTQFDNRLLMTASPGFSQGHGTYWRFLAPLDFFPISSMSTTSPPAWDGIWTGLKFLKPVTVKHFGIERCFVFVLNQADEIEVWEITKDARADYDTESRPIKWAFESRALGFANPYVLKNLMSADLFFDEVYGAVEFRALYRPDGYPCWGSWEFWNACATTELCAEDFVACQTLPNFKPQYRPMRQLKQPTDEFSETIQMMFRTFFELQIRMEITGYCRMKQMRVNAVLQPILPEMEQYRG